MNQKSAGMGCLGWLQLSLIILKLTGYIDWTWYMVWSPTLVAIGTVFIILFLIGIGALVLGVIDKILSSR